MSFRTKAIEEMKEIAKQTNGETRHIAADALLCRVLYDLSFEDLVQEYEKIGKWYA